jgi:hypothetical protein
MRPVLRTTNLALVESARLALESEEIPALTSNAFAAGLPFNLVTIAILSDADFERAVAFIDALKPAPVVGETVPPRPQRRVALFGVILLVLMVLAGFFLVIG